MKNLQVYADKAAIGLSFLCAIHCVVLPFAIVLLPSLAALPMNDERFHLWMIIAVIPTSIYAFTMGCKQHDRYQLFIYCGVGIALLLSALLSEELLHGASYGESLEKTLTLLGAAAVAYGHFKNYLLCKETRDCGCQDHSANDV